MEVIVACAADAMLSAFFRSVFATASSPDFLKFSRDQQVVAEIKKWERLLLKINACLDDAEDKKTTSSAVKLWLKDLKDVAFDAEDVVDELATEALRRTRPSASTNKVWKFIIVSCFQAINPNHIKFDAEIKYRIGEVTRKLDSLAAQKNFLNLAETGGGRSKKVLHKLPTSSLVDEPRVYGRDRDRDAIINLLMEGGDMDDGGIGVVSIVGMGGVGKTTVAQLVYNHERIKASFELRAWVCVSQDFDVLRVTEILLQAFDSNIGESKILDSFQVELKKKLSGRKFLIVLDDIWIEHHMLWDLLCRPFAAGAAGSKILITTRNESVAKTLGGYAASHHYLKELSNDDCLSLFTWHALRAKNFDGHPNLEVVGKKIVKRCKGLPLAVKALGGLLRTRVNQDEWEEILISKIWDLPEESMIIPALRLSYHHLPSYLKRCFAYCAIFPKDYEFDKDELVLLWMAEGFLQQPKRMKEMEDLGSEYFNELLLRCFFQQSTSNERQFVMHDLINDLAQSVSEETCYNFEDRDMHKDELCTDIEKIRHLSFTRKQYDTAKRFETLSQMKNVRTLTALPNCMPPWAACCYLSGGVLQNMLWRLRRLRVLCLSGYCIGELPNSIGQLKQLRYLNLSHSAIKQLPQSVGFLLNLQSMILRGCKELTNLPPVIKNLVNLRVLDLTATSKLKEMAFQIGNLKNLRILSKFIVGKGIESAVSELRGLMHLREELSILGLENVAEAKEVINANLKDKHGLTGLDLQWSHEFLNSRNEEAEMHVLDRLLPHRNLEKLRILFYGGKTFPSWLGDPSTLTNTVCLELDNCRKCISLPSLGRLPSLRMLTIKGMHRVLEVGLEFYGHNFPFVKPFPSLEILRLKDMLEWTCWSSPSQADEDSGKEFPCLQELVIEDCPKLSGKLPTYLSSLVKLVIKHCPKLEGSSMSFPSLSELILEHCNQELPGSILGLTSLTTLKTRSKQELQHLQNGVLPIPGALRVLKISNCLKLTSLWQKGDILISIASLERLDIKGCSEFVSLSETEPGLSNNLEELRMFSPDNFWRHLWKMHGLTSLKELRIESCSNLVFFPETKGLLPILKHLQLKDCQALTSLPSGIMMLDFPLEELEIEDCPALTCFPSGRLPTSLKQLKIGYCRDLMALPEGLMQIDYNTSNISHLEILEIINCPSLITFPEGRFPTGLKILRVWDCLKLKPLSDKMLQENASLELITICKCSTMTSLPECLRNLSHLTDLKLGRCHNLKYFPETGFRLPNLRKFDISNCSSLKSLPDQMFSLTSLQFLKICECPSLVSFPEGGLPPNLLVLDIWDCENLKPMSEWNLYTLASLRELNIAGAPDIVSFPDENCPLPTTLVSIYIGRLHNLKSLSTGLHNLTLLEELEINKCPKLQCLPRKCLPEKLGRLCIQDCQLLKQLFLKKKGGWPVIANIPSLEIEVTDDED